MKDHIAIIRRRLKEIDEENEQSRQQINELRTAGRLLANYLLTLARGKTASDAEMKKIEAAVRVFTQ